MAEGALRQFIKAVQDHYSAPNAKPLLLSRFGQRHGELLRQLKEEFGSLKAAVGAAGENEIKFVDTTVGREAVAPASIANDLQVQITGETASQREGAHSFESLPLSVQIAFCVRTEGGEHVALDIVRPFRFAKVTAPELIRPTQRLVADVYRKSGLALRNASTQERDALWRNFLAWADDAGVDVNVFMGGETTTALSRLIAAQPADVISRMIIPADIAQMLLKHS